MKVEIRQVDSPDQERAEIHAVKITEDIQRAIDILDHNCCVLSVTDQGRTLLCSADKIYYFESIDKKTYVYTKDACYETGYRLYELETMLGSNFLRIAKAMILNIRKIRSVKGEMNGRMTAHLLNGEKVIIARSYVKDFKERLGI
ncbi:MAG: LytTR family transcriptional regulator DNA-binding domain-containing protein [Lachnospiraceae bacterium]|nr:LytTR family transcriptional regulator DNA-binding domain-containing protein [Lachnospiraceae bacterium]